MALSKMWAFYPVKLHAKTAQSAAAVWIDGIQDVRINHNLQTLTSGGDGLPYDTFGALYSGAPMFSFTTHDLKAALDAIGMTGMLVDADGTHPGVVAYFQKYAEGSTRAAYNAGTHVSLTVANGLAIPRSITMSHRQDATVSLDVIARKESTTAPFVLSVAANTDNTIYPTDSLRWTVGKVMLNSTQVEAITSITVDTGFQLIVEAGDSDTYPTTVVIRKITPSVTIRSRHIDAWNTLSVDGAAYATDTLVFYARKRAIGSTFTADGTAEHIKFTMGPCRIDPVDVGGDPGEIGMKITPYYTAGVSPKYPLSLNTASAIT